MQQKLAILWRARKTCLRDCKVFQIVRVKKLAPHLLSEVKKKKRCIFFFLNMKVLNFRVALLRNPLKENKKNVNFHGIMLTSYDCTCEDSRNVFKYKEII